MAGDWLKFECNLPEKPETLAITSAMGWDDPDTTVGKLMRLFRWFDQHTIDGNARGVTQTALDRIIGVSGFAKAVSDCGWLVFDEHGVTLQKFDRHNGASAKSRVQTAKRVANHRGKRADNATETQETEGGNAAAVTTALAREEKSKRKNTPQPPKGGEVEVPDWIPAEPWGDFVAMRRAKGQRTPFTVGAARGIIKELDKLRREGHDPGLMLLQSVRNGWSDVFAPKAERGAPASRQLPGVI